MHYKQSIWVWIGIFVSFLAFFELISQTLLIKVISLFYLFYRFFSNIKYFSLNFNFCGGRGLVGKSDFVWSDLGAVYQMSRWGFGRRWLAEPIGQKTKNTRSLVNHQNTRNSLLNFITRETLRRFLKKLRRPWERFNQPRHSTENDGPRRGQKRGFKL